MKFCSATWTLSVVTPGVGGLTIRTPEVTSTR
jgi:hypothetical protein